MVAVVPLQRSVRGPPVPVLIFYYFHTLTLAQLSSALIYFGYMLLMSYFFAVCSGTIGFIASYFFVRYIYSAIKVD